MFTNVGGKLQMIAKIWFVLAVIASIVVGLVFIINGYDDVYIGIGVLIGGPIVAYIGSLILHGFGSIVSRNEF